MIAGEAAVRHLLAAIGEDLHRDGLRGTPSRVFRAFLEMTAGHDENPVDVLRTADGSQGFSVPGDSDQMVVVKAIPFWSTCEHHLLPFGGTVDVGYLPGPTGLVVGLSKIPRLVDVFARRLQIQERLTGDIARAMNDCLHPQGVGVRVEARHLCTSCRGIRKDVSMVTSRLTGAFREHAVRDEFWSLAGRL